MPETIIRTRGLRKVYRNRRGQQVAVDDLDLDVPSGGVHGFLGPNGSGKTTTIRMLLGLARASGGTMEVLGQKVPRRLPRAAGRIGAVVEQPRFFPGFTARRNLELLARAGGIPGDRVADVLERVGLAGRADDRFKGYSLGMKQRLAIAATLLKEPELLLLDEPTNGLDPQGIRDIRDMIRGLGRAGVTVLLSSHLLTEVEQVCDTVTILNRGRLVRSGAVADLLAGRRAGILRVRVSDPARAYAILVGSRLRVQAEREYLSVRFDGDPATINRLLADAGLYVSELTPVQVGLEDAFLDLISPAAEGAAG